MKLVFLIITLCCLRFSPNAQFIQAWKAADIRQALNRSDKKIVVLNAWATFCKPCVEEIPHFIEAIRPFSDRVELILMSVDSKEVYPGKLKRFIRQHHFNEGVTHAWLNETDANYFCPFVDSTWEGSIPATLIYDRASGRRYFIEDSLTKEALLAVLNEMLKEHQQQ